MKCTMCKGEGKVIIDNGMCVCPICEGTRAILKCKECKGSGLTIFSNNNSWKTGPCMICIGHGFVPEALYNCLACDNTGIIIRVSTDYNDDGSTELIGEPDYCGCKERRW